MEKLNNSVENKGESLTIADLDYIIMATCNPGYFPRQQESVEVVSKFLVENIELIGSVRQKIKDFSANDPEEGAIFDRKLGWAVAERLALQISS